MPELVDADSVNAEKLAASFNAHGAKARVDERGNTVVSTDFEWLAAVDSEKRLVVFHKAFAFREDASREDKLELVNKLNHSVVLARFSMPREDILVADYYFSYEHGLHPRELVRSFRLFNLCVTGMGGALRKFDENSLMK